MTLALGVAKHAPVAGLVSQTKRVTGRLALPVSAEAVIIPPEPTFAVATANTPVPSGPGILETPSFVNVAAKATMSGTGLAEADRSKVLRPD